MEVRGRWRKEVKDIVPNKKADGRFECVAQQACRPMLIGVCFFLFRPNILIPRRALHHAAVPLSKRKGVHGPRSSTVCPPPPRERKKKMKKRETGYHHDNPSAVLDSRTGRMNRFGTNLAITVGN